MYFAAVLLAAAAAVKAAPANYDDGYETVNSATQPVQVRMSYQGPTAMMVSWNTFSQIQKPTVKYGLEPFYLYQTASSADSYTYPTSLTYMNHVNLTGLLPDTTYYYLPQGGNDTTPYSFTTGRAAGDMDPFSVAVVVDMGTFGPLGLGTTTGVGAANPLKPGEQTTIQSISKQLSGFDFMVHPGDLGYADAWLKEEIQMYLPNTSRIMYPTVYEHINNAFYDELMNITAYKPYMVSPGNHEANCDNGGTTDKTTGVKYTEAICPVGQTNFTGFRNRFRMPSARSGGLENFWYSYDHGMAHFVSIDTETDLGHGLVGPDEGSPEFGGPFGLMNQQINWLTNDLASVDRTKTPWVVVLGHRPFYNSAGGICANCITAFEDIFHQYGVDLYFCGHSHVYNRNAPIYKNITDPNELNNPNATWYIVNGAAGHYDGLDTLNYPLMPYTRYAQDTAYSWSKLIFHNCTHLTQQAIDSGNGTVYDQATLFKNRTCEDSSQFPFTIPTGVPTALPTAW
ncbi:Metallo-dependent phosphatase [Lecanosticta acicola]|uniref:Purple acid phosphatase n=1 Tax=Lecanosticta acicola TaxID=111012 RepID=A0AAI8YX07_9PEZI|nr:Metallo-dependent phosphatase [Lecanosticta acicola]